MDFDFLTFKFHNIVDFFKKKTYLIYLFFLFICFFSLFFYIRNELIKDSSKEYYQYIQKSSNFSKTHKYGIYNCVEKWILKNNQDYTAFKKKDCVLYGRVFNFYDLINNFNKDKYDYNLEGSNNWKILFKSTRILGLDYTKDDTKLDSDIPFFLRVYIGNEEENNV